VFSREFRSFVGPTTAFTCGARETTISPNARGTRERAPVPPGVRPNRTLACVCEKHIYLAIVVHDRVVHPVRGVQWLVAITVVAELGDLTRFANPRQLAAFVGLIPSEHSSGPSPDALNAV